MSGKKKRPTAHVARRRQLEPLVATGQVSLLPLRPN